MKKRVAIVSPMVLSSASGAGRKTLLTLDVLRELGYDVTLFAIKGGITPPRDVRTIELDDYEVRYDKALSREIEKEFFFLRKYFPKIFSTIVGGHFDVVQISGGARAVPQAAAFLAAKTTRAKTVYLYNDLIPETATLMRGLSYNGLLCKLLIVFERILFKLSNVVIVVSDTMKSYLVRRHGKKFGHRIEVVYPYVNLREFARRPRAKDLIRKFGIPEGEAIIIYVGKLEPVIRGLEDLVSVFAKLVRQRRVRAYLLLVGEGSIRKKLEQMAAREKVKDRVILTGNIVHEEAVELVREANVAVISYPESIDTHIAIPTKIVEYMAAGKIIVVSKLAQTKRMLGENAMYYDTKNPCSFADALEKAVTRVDKPRRLSQKVREIAAMFDQKVIKRKIEKLYRNLG
nr:glycosyltransferase family 4 protein [Candidatus Njordarchaeota archaeon]